MAAVASSASCTRFRVRLLGPFQVWREDVPLDVERWPRRSRSLLTLLVTAPDRRRLRDEVIDLLWPDADPAAGASNLRGAVHLLRRGLGDLEPSPILVERGWISLTAASTWDVDLDRFDAPLHASPQDAEALHEALSLVGGEVLPEDRYEDWAQPIRDRVEREWREGCLRLVEHHRAEGEQAEASRWLERLLDRDPLDETVLQQVLGILGAMGRRIEALRLYEQFRQRLRGELDLEPSAETVTLVEGLKAPGEVRSGAMSAPSDQPAGLHTFLIADVRGYTRFTQQHGDEAAAALAATFAAIAREVVTAHGGRVIELRGDEALAVFSSVRQALRAALAIQARCAREADVPLHVGIGLDVGEAIPVEGGYRGGALNLAARLCSLAGPGDVFASEGVIHTARTMEGLVYLERGEVQLKGLPEPVRVIQIVPEGAVPTDLPRFTIHVTRACNLPAQPTTFIGREREVLGISGMLRRGAVHLLTLTGPGGTGKTRLALQVAGDLLDTFADGIFFVSLASVSDPDLVASTIASTLNVKESADQPLLDALRAFLHEKELLLVLDNFEHLLEAAPLVGELLAASPVLKVLVTSREPLHLSAEHRYPVPPLAVPDPKRLPPLASLAQYDAVALFIERAQAVKPDFVVTNATAPALAQVCSRLDGLPLAIELAAARVPLFPLPALLSRLERCLALLTGGARDAPARLQTLRGTIDWSYGLLSPAEQLLFARLAVFAGGCTLDGVEAVCTADTASAGDVLEGVASLVEKSLLRQEGEEEPRFAMLETIREYALGRLEERGDDQRMRQAHAEYYLALAEQAEPELRGSQQVEWLRRLEGEHDNLRAALEWALDGRATDLGLALAGALGRFWELHAHLSEGRRWLERVLTSGDGESSLARARALEWEGVLTGAAGDYARATALCEESIALFQQLGDEHGAFDVRVDLQNVVSCQGDAERAAQMGEENLTLARELGDKHRIARCLGNLGIAAIDQGEYKRAGELIEEELVLSRELGNKQLMAASLGNLGELAHRQGDDERATRLLQAGLRIMRELGHKVYIVEGLDRLAAFAGAQGEIERAARLWGAADAAREAIGAPRTVEQRAYEDPERAAAQAGIDPARWTPARQEGEAMTLEQAVAYALDEP